MPLKRRFFLATSLIPFSLTLMASSAMAQLEEVMIFGRAEEQVGIAIAASEGTVGGADLLVRPLLRVAELLEAVPGMIAAFRHRQSEPIFSAWLQPRSRFGFHDLY